MAGLETLRIGQDRAAGDVCARNRTKNARRRRNWRETESLVRGRKRWRKEEQLDELGEFLFQFPSPLGPPRCTCLHAVGAAADRRVGVWKSLANLPSDPWG